MSADGLRKAVLDRARAAADETVAKAKVDAAAVIASAKERAERAGGDVVERARREAETQRARELSALDRELRLETLTAKNSAIDAAFRRGAELFKALGTAELSALYARELADVALEGTTVLVASGATGQVEFVRSRGAAVKEDPSVDAGYVVVRADYRLDRTLAARVNDLRATIRGELARVLFGDQA